MEFLYIALIAVAALFLGLFLMAWYLRHVAREASRGSRWPYR